MSANLFISYSHKDDSHRESLETHLSLLKRNKLVSTWSDRCIEPGQKWSREIDENLENSDIIMFLVSSDFIGSDYCVDIEVERAIQKHEEGSAIVVPVIVRSCDWQDTALGKFQSLPDNANPITKWEDIDEAWLSVVKGIKKVLNTNKEKSSETMRQDSLWTNVLNPAFGEWLNDTEIELSHRKVDKVHLDDVFVFQDLKRLDQDIDKVVSTIEASGTQLVSDWNIIFGDEQSGKTSLAKTIFIRALESGLTPLYLSGKDIKQTSLERLLRTPLKRQYLDCDVEMFLRQKNILIIVDDYPKTTLNRSHQNELLGILKDRFKNIILLADDSFQYVVPDIASLDGFLHFEINPFGNTKRHELIKKWVEIGVKEEIDEHELYENIDSLKIHIDTLIKNNIVPSKPIYLLTILQTFESYNPLGIELTSYGHCYQYLIYKALEKSNIKHTEIDAHINYLTELAGYIFMENSSELSEEQMEAFAANYYTKYVGPNQSEILNRLVMSNILLRGEGAYSFKYPYIYYFYAGKFLSENLVKSDESKARIKGLIDNLHKEDSANIIIFVTHHTKDSWVIDEIQLCMMELFDEYPEATLSGSDLSFMKEFLDEIPKLVLEQREIEEERRNQNIAKDRAEQIENKLDEESSDLEPSDLLAKINRAFKGIELIGQIVRNRHGSLDRSMLLQLLEQAYGAGLRFLQYFLTLSDTAKEEIIQVIRHMLEENPKVNNEKLEKEARNLFLLMTYGVIYAVLRKIAFSVGTKEIDEIHKELSNSINTPAVKLIDKTIEMQFLKKIDVKSLGLLSKEFETNPVCGRVLKEIVIQHVYMHHVGYKEKQQISEAIQLPVENQLYIERQKPLKM